MTGAETPDVTLAALGLLGTTIAAMIWIVKYFANTLSKDIREHTEAATMLAQAAQEQKAASSEVLKFMKNLNGKLENATIQKAAEQTIKNRK